METLYLSTPSSLPRLSVSSRAKEETEEAENNFPSHTAEANSLGNQLSPISSDPENSVTATFPEQLGLPPLQEPQLPGQLSAHAFSGICPLSVYQTISRKE